MSYEFHVTLDERKYLRELAAKVLEYAHLPIMQERRRLWYNHNSLKGDRPMVVMEVESFEKDLLPPLQCTSDAAREIEYNLMKPIVNHELVDDDKVISPYYEVFWRINFRLLDLYIKTFHAKDNEGRDLGYAWQHPIRDLKSDFYLIKPSYYSVDRDYTMAWKTFVEEIMGDILPVKVKNRSLRWHFVPSSMIVNIMGQEKMMLSMMDYPDEMHKLFNFIKKDILGYLRWQEQEGLLTLNNENDYVGAGSYGFTDELPTENFKRNGRVTSKDLWMNMNSQETVPISPEMFGEFAFPCYQELAKEFGLVYYGCCEPVHNIWDKFISQIPGLRKVSISPWCDEEFMGKALCGSNVIYSRKPSPNYIGVGNFDEESFKEHIAYTLKAAKGCQLEIIFRDVYTLTGDRSKPGKAVRITRNLIEKMW